MTPRFCSSPVSLGATWLTCEPNSVPGISAVPHEDNLRYFDVEIHGPTQSPYEGQQLRPQRQQAPGWTHELLIHCTLAGGIFKLELFLPEDYPMTPPKIRFLTKIFHPNVDKLGRICLDVLKSRANNTFSTCLAVWQTANKAFPVTDNWSPALQIRTILLSIQALLGAPNPDDPLAADVAKSWKEDEAAAINMAKEWTAKYAQA